ncbi:TetR/AcrR family transcriptional regulator [Aquabacter cavernae]|uniref:TetR/AcrR family transcriptional regulator n=1 Tax=Aquabacter cavernae TaxID=2496029 RepID=UPI000F8D9ADC|nr:TetR/AcrR family transcriptional regulator [Aquabacter cavernae]
MVDISPRVEMTRARLRAAAIAVFARKGFHDTKVSDIVAEAGLSQPAFYLHYASKDAAYEALVAAFRTRLLDATRQCLIFAEIRAADVPDNVRASFVRFLTVLSADPALTEIGFYQLPGSSLTRAQMTLWSMENMRQEQAAGILRADIPVLHQAQLVMGLLDQMGRLTPDEVPGIADICAALFCSALVVRK